MRLLPASCDCCKNRSLLLDGVASKVLPKYVLLYVQGLYCDVRQFINYVKEVHGGIFRRVALCGLMNVTRTETITVHNEPPAASKAAKMGPAVSR